MPPAWASIAVASTLIACTVMVPTAVYQPEYSRAATAMGVGIPLCALAYGLIIYAFIWYPLRSMAEDVRNKVPPPETLCTSDIRRIQAAMRVVVTRATALTARVYHSEISQRVAPAVPIPMLRLDAPLSNPMRRVEQLPPSRQESPVLAPYRQAYFGSSSSTPPVRPTVAQPPATHGGSLVSDLVIRDPFELDPAAVAAASAPVTTNGGLGSTSSVPLQQTLTSEFVNSKQSELLDCSDDGIVAPNPVSIFGREMTNTSTGFYSCGPTPREADE